MKDALATIPTWQRQRCMALHSICLQIQNRRACGIALKIALQEACKRHSGRVLGEFNGRAKMLSLSFSTLRRAYTRWSRNGHCPASFKVDYKGPKTQMPPELILEFQRRATLEGMEAISRAIDWLKADWRDGKELPGLGTWKEWWVRDDRTKHLPLPDGPPEFPFSDRTLYNYKPSKAEKAWGNKGAAEARKYLPHTTRDYSGLRPAQLYTLDDVRLDLIVVDDFTGRPANAVAYIMMEVGSRRIVSFVMRPANAMKSKDVDACICRGLQVCGIGVDYETHILLEHGTVAMSEPAKNLLETASEGRIVIDRTSMNGGRRWQGAPADRSSGHWMGKAVIESFMRKLHLALMNLPGQRGNHYRNQPANLGFKGDQTAPTKGSLLAEAEKLLNIENYLDGRVRLDLGMMRLMELNAIMHQAMEDHNAERGRSYQGHGKIKQIETAPNLWKDFISS